MNQSHAISIAAFATELTDVLSAATWLLLVLSGLAVAVNRWRADAHARSMLDRLLAAQTSQNESDQQRSAKERGRRFWFVLIGVGADLVIFAAAGWSLWGLAQSPAPATTGSVARCAALAGMMVVSSLRKW